MTLLDPASRAARGMAVQAESLARAPSPARTLLDQSWRDFVFADVWSRGGLDRRARYLIALAGSALSAAKPDMVEAYAHGALSSGELSLAELREASLQLAVYAGWSRGQALDDAVTRAAEVLKLPEGVSAPLRVEAWDAEEGRAGGEQEFLDVMTMAPAAPETPYYNAIQHFVFGEMWKRRDLDQRGRRWVTLVSVCDGGAEIPIKTHIYAAMATKNCTPEEMQEFVLQYALHAGWPKASLVQAVVDDLIYRVENGLPWYG